jgi:hypothetical protein
LEASASWSWRDFVQAALDRAASAFLTGRSRAPIYGTLVSISSLTILPRTYNVEIMVKNRIRIDKDSLRIVRMKYECC